MEIYAYEVRIEGNANITTHIADSDRLLGTFVNKLKRLISDHKLRNENERTKKPVVVGLAAVYSAQTVFILQLCFDTHCVIIQLIHPEISRMRSCLNDFFADQDIVFVGFGIRDKLAILGNTYKLQCSKNVIELGSLADRVCRKLKFIKYNLEELAREIIGIKIKKPDRADLASYWAPRDLTSEQIEYATITAYAAYSIGNKLLAGGGNN